MSSRATLHLSTMAQNDKMTQFTAHYGVNDWVSFMQWMSEWGSHFGHSLSSAAGDVSQSQKSEGPIKNLNGRPARQITAGLHDKQKQKWAWCWSVCWKLEKKMPFANDLNTMDRQMVTGNVKTFGKLVCSAHFAFLPKTPATTDSTSETIQRHAKVWAPLVKISVTVNS